MYKAVTRVLRRGRDVLSSVRLLAARVAWVLDPILGAYLDEGEAFAGAEKFQIAVMRWNEDGLERLKELEQAHRETLMKLRVLRDVRNEREDNLYVKVLSVRRTFEDAFGSGTAVTYLGLVPKLGEESRDVLERYARHAFNALMDPLFTTPPPRVEGLWDRPRRYAAQIRESLEAFESSLAAIEAQKRNVEVALIAKAEHLELIKARLKWSTRFFEALYHLSGLGLHAERLRTPTPSPKRARGEEVGQAAADDSQTLQSIPE